MCSCESEWVANEKGAARPLFLALQYQARLRAGDFFAAGFVGAVLAGFFLAGAFVADAGGAEGAATFFAETVFATTGADAGSGSWVADEAIGTASLAASRGPFLALARAVVMRSYALANRVSTRPTCCDESWCLFAISCRGKPRTWKS